MDLAGRAIGVCESGEQGVTVIFHSNQARALASDLLSMAVSAEAVR